MSVRSYVFEVCAREYPFFRDPVTGSHDKDGFKASVLHTVANDPVMGRLFRAEAIDAFLSELVKQFVRTDMGGFVIEDRQSRAAMRRAVRMRTFVEIPLGGNAYDRKRRIDMTRSDVVLLEQFHARKEQAHAREVRWCREVRTAMDAAGLIADDDPVSAVVTQAA